MELLIGLLLGLVLGGTITAATILSDQANRIQKKYNK